MTWREAQTWEASWWGSCVNTYGEEEKQLVYARKMGLEFYHDGKSPYNIDLGGRSVLDIGGGPCSLLLKCTNTEKMAVLDPLSVPSWVLARYRTAGIELIQRRAEDYAWPGFDEVWIYNCLQHTDDPALVIKLAKLSAPLIRIFEWIDTAVNVGHPHALTAQWLDEQLGGEGKVEHVNERNCKGWAYYGIFVGSP